MNSRRTPHNSREAGFTLIELLVVVIIIGVLAAIAAPSWGGFLNRQRVSAVRSDLIATLRNTQQDAIQRRQARRIQVDTAAVLPTLKIGPRQFDASGNNLVDIFSTQTLGSDVSNKGNISLNAYVVTGGNQQPVNEIVFDHQGLLVEGTNLPFVITVTSANSPAKQCVIVATLLGSLKTANGAECDNPSFAVN